MQTFRFSVVWLGVFRNATPVFYEWYCEKLYIAVMTTLKKRFGKRLRRLRIKRELTQESLAEKSGLSVDFVSLMERGINAPSFDTIEQLAIALDVGVKELFDFDDETET